MECSQCPGILGRVRHLRALAGSERSARNTWPMNGRHTRIGKPEYFLIIGLTLILTGAVFVLVNDRVATWNVSFFQAWTAWAVKYGYIGALLTAFVGNLTIVIIFPYTV